MGMTMRVYSMFIQELFELTKVLRNADTSRSVSLKAALFTLKSKFLTGKKY